MKYVCFTAEKMPRVMYAHECVIDDVKTKMRSNSYYELTLVEGGALRIKSDELGLDETATEGHFLFMPSGVAYETIIYGQMKHSCVAFFADDKCEIVDEQDVVFNKSDNSVFISLGKIYVPVSGKVTKLKTKDVISRIIDACNDQQDEYANLKCSHLAVELLLSVARTQNHGRNLPSDEYYAEKINKYISSSYSDPEICLNLIAEKVGLHPNYLSAVYKRVTGNNVMAAVRELRITQAKKLLKLNKYLVKDVARLVGFTDYNYFSAVFKKTTGVTAEEFYKGKW